MLSRAPSPQTRAILDALLAQPLEWRHGYDLAKLVGLGSGTLYPILIRLHGRGLLDAEWIEPDKPGRPARHAYRLSTAGLAHARQLQDRPAAAPTPRAGGAGMIAAARNRLTAWLLASACHRLGGDKPDWARAMLAEADACASASERLRWAWGCWIASLRDAAHLKRLAYAPALLTGLGLMTAYEWSADESRATLAVLALITAALGTLWPSKALLSGALLGMVVTGVIGFEAVSGIRPAYEAHAQTLHDGVCWLVLLAPAVAAAILGARLGHRLRPAANAR